MRAAKATAAQFLRRTPADIAIVADRNPHKQGSICRHAHSGVPRELMRLKPAYVLILRGICAMNQPAVGGHRGWAADSSRVRGEGVLTDAFHGHLAGRLSLDLEPLPTNAVLCPNFSADEFAAKGLASNGVMQRVVQCAQGHAAACTSGRAAQRNNCALYGGRDFRCHVDIDRSRLFRRWSVWS